MANFKVIKGQVFKVEFTVFKAGVTENPVKILSKKGEYFNKTEKLAKYISLGYTIL